MRLRLSRGVYGVVSTATTLNTVGTLRARVSRGRPVRRA